MEAVVLTEAQRQQALSSSKKNAEKNVRNVLASPFEKYWPVINQIQENELAQLIEKTLLPAKIPVVSVPWSALHTVPHEKRRDVRKKHLLKSKCDIKSYETSKELRNYLVLGVNAVTRALEQEELCSVLLAKDVDPRMIVNHVTTLCGIRGVPLVVLSHLRSAVLQVLGFACIALGLKKCVADSSENHFYHLHAKISKLSSLIPVPEHLKQFHSIKDDEKDHTVAEEKMDLQDSNDASTVNQTTKESKQGSSESGVSAGIYKYRTSKKTRVFIPDREENISEKSDVNFLAFTGETRDSNWSSIIQSGHKANTPRKTYKKPLRYFEDDPKADLSKNVFKRKAEVTYQPLVIKKIRPNPERKKRKKKK